MSTSPRHIPPTPQPTPQLDPSKNARAEILFFGVLGVVIVALSIAAAVRRLVELTSQAGIAVPVQFDGLTTPLPIGPGGSGVPVQVDVATVTAPGLPIASLVAAVLEALFMVGTVVVVVACLLIVARNILRGVIFSRTQSRVVTTAVIAALIGAAAVPFFANMVANGAVAVISGNDFFDTVVMAIDPVPYLLGAFGGSVLITAFRVGDRLRRETEGLV